MEAHGDASRERMTGSLRRVASRSYRVASRVARQRFALRLISQMNVSLQRLRRRRHRRRRRRHHLITMLWESSPREIDCTDGRRRGSC